MTVRRFRQAIERGWERSAVCQWWTGGIARSARVTYYPASDARRARWWAIVVLSVYLVGIMV